MKIALYNLTTTTKHGGVESFVWEVGRCLADRGHQVTLFGGKGNVRRPYPELQIKQYPYIARETWGRNRALRASLNLLKLLERLSMARHAIADLIAGDYDVVQLSKPYDFPIGAWLKRQSRARVVYNAQGTDFFPGDRLFRKVIDRSYSCSRYNATMVERRYLFPITVSFNGFDEQIFQPLPADPGLRDWLSPDGAPLLFYVGRLMTFKGIDYLIDALGLLRQEGLSPRLLIAGDGPHRAGLETRARQAGVADRINFLGSIPNAELPRYHAVSSMFILPSTDHETFGIAACEAMACERPVIGAATGGIPEVVSHEQTGLLVPPANPAALAAAIRQLLANPEQARAYGQAGRTRVMADFTWERVTDRVEACIQ